MNPTSNLTIRMPTELEQFFGDPPLVGDEKREDYENFFHTLTSAAKPTDVIGWLLVKDIVDLSWEIRRERSVKAEIIKLMQKEVTVGLLASSLRDEDSYGFVSSRDAEKMMRGSRSGNRINRILAKDRNGPPAILARAFMRGDLKIDAIDARIASYEQRRTALLREIDRRGEQLTKQLGAPSAEVIDAEFSEAAE